MISPHRARFDQLTQPLLTLRMDHASGRLLRADYLREYNEVLVTCGWTRDEYFQEIDRRGPDLSWVEARNPRA